MKSYSAEPWLNLLMSWIDSRPGSLITFNLEFEKKSQWELPYEHVEY